MHCGRRRGRSTRAEGLQSHKVSLHGTQYFRLVLAGAGTVNTTLQSSTSPGHLSELAFKDALEWCKLFDLELQESLDGERLAGGSILYMWLPYSRVGLSTGAAEESYQACVRPPAGGVVHPYVQLTISGTSK